MSYQKPENEYKTQRIVVFDVVNGENFDNAMCLSIFKILQSNKIFSNWLDLKDILMKQNHKIMFCPPPSAFSEKNMNSALIVIKDYLKKINSKTTPSIVQIKQKITTLK